MGSRVFISAPVEKEPGISSNGRVGYQMMAALKLIFRPGGSRYEDKKNQRQDGVIRGIGTMRSNAADVHQFARFIRSNWPDVKDLFQVRPEMAQAYIAELANCERSGGRIGRVCASIRKLDIAAHTAGIFPASALPLLPYKAEGGIAGFHSQLRPIVYTPHQAKAIVDWIKSVDPTVARLLTLMTASGLRVTEASNLRAQDIDIEKGLVYLYQEGNVNRTKGGRPRQVNY
jgi:integrase